jgi:uncharacterized protein YjbI with pentapeptide repeats
MTDFMNHLTQMLSTPWVPWIILGVISVGVLLGQVQKTGPSKPLRFSETGWLNALGWFSVLFSPVLILLFLSVLFMLAQVGWKIVTGDTVREGSDNLRWYVLSFVGLLTALGGIIGTPLALLRVWTTERQTKTAEQNHFNEILSKAVENLGAEKTVKRSNGVEKSVPSLEVRTGGILALERLARENPGFHIEVMEVLTAYIRHNVQSYVEYKGEHEGAIRPRDDLVTAFNVLSRRTKAQREIENRDGYQLQLNDTTFSGLVLADYDLSGINFERTNFSGAHLTNLNFEHSNLNSCNFKHARFLKIQMNSASFANTSFQTASLNQMQIPLVKILDGYGQKMKYSFLHRCEVQMPTGSKFLQLDPMHFSSCSFTNEAFSSHGDGAFKKCVFDACDLRNTGISQTQLDSALGTSGCKLDLGLTTPEHWDTIFVDDDEWRAKVELIERAKVELIEEDEILF